MNITRFIRTNAMAVTMVVGVVIGLLEEAGLFTYRLPDWILPSLIFAMLFFTFLRIRPGALRLYPWHWTLLLTQIGVSMAIYYALAIYNVALAQGVMLCVLMPAATAAPIIAGKLGGTVEHLTSFTLLSSVSSAFLIPLIFPFINPEAHIPFVDCFVKILQRVGPVLLTPALCAWALRYARNISLFRRLRRIDKVMMAFRETPFWLWMCTLVILMARITTDLFAYDGDGVVLLYISIGSLLTCILQFMGGKWIGQSLVPTGVDNMANRVTAGQALGQKNTTLGIWLAQTYLNPISSLAPAAYIIWQNAFNAWQLRRVAMGKRI